MFVRIKSKSKDKYNKSVQLVESSRVNGKVVQTIVKHIGVAYNDEQLDELRLLAKSIQITLENVDKESLFQAEELIEDLTLEGKYDQSIYSDEDYNVDIRNLEEESRTITGIHDIYGKLYDELKVGSIIANPARNVSVAKIFKEMVISRIANPDSKRGSVADLEEKYGVEIDLDKVYRMMDKLDDIAIAKLNTLSYNKTKELFGDKIDVIYFDATTIYFESFTEDTGEDALKKNGYSKDLKFNQPQVVLALMVTKEGLPIGYEAFSGDTFDGHTLIPSLKILREKYNIDNVVYVADSGMFNKNNLQELDQLEEHKFNYIVGARIKNISKSIKEQILNMNDYLQLNEDIKVKNITLDNGRKLIVTHSLKRARKDKTDREKGIIKLREKLQKNRSVKTHLSTQGFKKYLQLEETKDEATSCDFTITLNEEKIVQDALWDGLKGLIVNKDSKLTNDEILTQYSNLWQVEESFRITKSDLKIRPVYHWKPSRVKAHLAISFAALFLVRHLEYRVKVQYKKLSPKKIKELLLSVQHSTLVDKTRKIKYAIPSKTNVDINKLYRIMGLKKHTTPYILGKF
ncbi:transposase, IS1634 family [Arcobacter acticola]|jgi:transposase|uniref:Transposase, IS1634 family n=1 Tax=Arcobacter acticola TaxID=1849015 RepID=A0A6M8EYC8_9BACT|nr:IS1634 family transposase [Arcobacter acticola]QKE29565.1 transposase, IS1634 family [Arcobacter acticola]